MGISRSKLRVFLLLFVASSISSNLVAEEYNCRIPLLGISKVEELKWGEDVYTEFSDIMWDFKKLKFELTQVLGKQDNESLKEIIQEWMDKTYEKREYLPGLSDSIILKNVDKLMLEGAEGYVQEIIGNHSVSLELQLQESRVFPLEMSAWNEVMTKWKTEALGLYALKELHKRMISGAIPVPQKSWFQRLQSYLRKRKDKI